MRGHGVRFSPTAVLAIKARRKVERMPALKFKLKLCTDTKIGANVGVQDAKGARLCTLALLPIKALAGRCWLKSPRTWSMGTVDFVHHITSPGHAGARCRLHFRHHPYTDAITWSIRSIEKAVCLYKVRVNSPPRRYSLRPQLFQLRFPLLCCCCRCL